MLFVLAILPGAPAGCSQRSQEDQRQSITVFAAASLTDVIEQIAHDFTARTGIKVQISAAGSATLVRQIEGGAPADVFLSADEQWVDYLDDKGMIDSSSRTEFAGNQLVFIAPADRDVKITVDPAFDIASAFSGRLSIADPETIPAGRYARQALERLGWWATLKPRVAPAMDVRSALMLVEFKEAGLGMVYRTDTAGRDRVRIVAPIDESLTGPVRDVGCAIHGASPGSHDFLKFLSDESSREHLTQAGFIVPEAAEP